MSHRIPNPGELVWDDEDKTWWLRCPACLQTGSLEEYQVTWKDGKPTLDASIICECEAHYTVKDGVYYGG